MKLMPRSPDLSSAALDWSGIEAYRLSNPPRWQLQLPPINRHFIVAHLSNPCELSTRWNGLERRSRSVPGNIMIMSAHQGSYWAWKGEIEELHIFLEPGAVEEAVDELGDKPVRLMDGSAYSTAASWTSRCASATSWRNLASAVGCSQAP
jgi:hypothetical protein